MTETPSMLSPSLYVPRQPIIRSCSWCPQALHIIVSPDQSLLKGHAECRELNKFAPSGNVKTPLKEGLIDITARGRSLGLILFGAEQFASSVDKEIVENSSTYLFGRTENNELRTPNYSAFSDEVKTKLTMLPQGQLLVKFAKFPQPIFVRFPFPPCLPGDQFDSGEE